MDHNVFEVHLIASANVFQRFITPVEFTDRREGEGVGEVPNHTTTKKPSLLYLIQYSLVFTALLDGANVRLNWNIESDLNVNWIKFKYFFSLY
jgi:hypothetical protein